MSACPGGQRTVRLQEMKRADMPAIIALEQELFPEDAWTPEMFAAEFAQPPSRRLYLVAEDGNVLAGYAGMMFTGGTQADGVVPEVASRAHRGAMIPTFDRALATAGVGPGQIDAVAVTAGPGLAGALLVGVAAAKAFSFALGKPLYGVNHLAAHIAVDQLEHGTLPSPAVALLVSGGHSSLLLVPDVAEEVIPLGATIDDAAGEAYDKVARVLGMPFPGGPPIHKAAPDADTSP